jgi:cellulose synthase/poly-beta-1,6-N-acetylglucosamine synthase-like glycosyltransferase
MAVTLLLSLFLGAFALVWLSVFGYLLILMVGSRKNRPAVQPVEDWPEIAIVVPTLNEEQLIVAKLADLREIDYPPDRVHVVVVDGGSADQTAQLVQQEIASGADVQLVQLPGVRRKVAQVIHGLEIITQEFVVFTDADSRLETSSVKAMIQELKRDERTAIVGATVVPDSALLEEQVHWSCLNALWWLEGEVFGSAGFSGACYAARREAITSRLNNAMAEDIHLAMAASSEGRHVRLCRGATAYEVRAPQSLREYLQFRRRRGTGYLTELRRQAGLSHAPWWWRLAQRLKIWHFTTAPKLCVALVLTGLPLVATSHWPVVVGAGLASLIPWLAAVGAVNRRLYRRVGWAAATFAGVRFTALIAVSLLALPSSTAVQVPRGGEAPGDARALSLAAQRKGASSA